MACGSTPLVPSVLTEIAAVDDFYVSVEQAPPIDLYAFSICTVIVVKPYGVIALLSAARHLASASGHPVRVENPAGDVGAYLDRVDPRDVGLSWLKGPSVRMDDRGERKVEHRWVVIGVCWIGRPRTMSC